MSIEIKVGTSVEEGDWLEPIEVFGAPHGEVYQQYFDGEPQHDFLIGAGKCERPINIWWSDESNEYRLSSDSKKDLRGFVPSVKYRHIPNAKVYIVLDI